MKYASAFFLTVTAVLLLAAVWMPGQWWQWLLTAGVTMLGFGYCEGKADRK